MSKDKNIDSIFQKALLEEWLTIEEGLSLFRYAALPDLMMVAHEIRKNKTNPTSVSWIIDRNVNITNVCLSACKFCNFHRVKNSPEAYITCMDEYRTKIEELYIVGGDQLLLQGGMHPGLKLDFYIRLFSDLKKEYPHLKLHALGPAEIDYLAKAENKSHHEILKLLIDSGLDSLPGAGAEILSDRVRKYVSPAKCSANEWLDVMRAAHQLGMVTSATMMFGHYETLEERMEHLVKLRQVQSEKPKDSPGFVAFIPWPFQDEHTRLRDKHGVINQTTSEEYIRMIALSRLMLPNIINIQASWLTIGLNTAQLCLWAGANDLGSIMIEENVVSAAGATHKANADVLIKAIEDAGYKAFRRNQKYEAYQR